MNLWRTDGLLTERATQETIELLLVRGSVTDSTNLGALVRPLRFEVACGVDVVARALAAGVDDHELVAALVAAPWGPQSGGGFITVHSHAHGRDGETRTYHAPHRRGIRALAMRDGEVWTTVRRWTAQQAWQNRRTDRARFRARHEAYLRALRVTAAVLASGQRLERTPGQQGGTVRVPGGGVAGFTWVSARGAERLAAELEHVDARRVSRRRPADALRALCGGA